MPATVLLWDFGDTLVDERWMRRAPDGYPDWEAAWTAVMTELAGGWDVGAIGVDAVYAALADRTGLSLEAVEAHAVDCCRAITFHPVAWQLACERRRPQALVTVNPDLFTDLVAPPHGLADVFDHIVVSHLEETDDKVALCEIALDRLGFHGSRSEALLIDNRRDLVEAWRRTGGSAYWFRGDERFALDVPDLLGDR